MHGKEPGDSVQHRGITQPLWPVHCVQVLWNTRCLMVAGLHKCELEQVAERYQAASRGLRILTTILIARPTPWCSLLPSGKTSVGL